MSIVGRSLKIIAVHPHARGDNLVDHPILERTRGSPPRPWGQSNPLRPLIFDNRFTPTPVGTIQRAAACRHRYPVHPHARGDNVMYAGKILNQPGSPPRPWGQCCRQPDNRPRPAVHPHARGDNSCCSLQSFSRAGSPPRPWGQCRSPQPVCPRIRFTPTPVGTIVAGRTMVCSPSVHPHARGDNAGQQCRQVAIAGSPPRPWGQSEQFAAEQAALRFTPTPVGTMAPPALMRPPFPVHPHARGDNKRWRLMARPIYGSPPRPWGQ